MKKIKALIITPIVILFAFFLLFYTSEWLFPSWWGSYSLGHNLYMMDWDGGGRIIVYCNNPRGRTCYGGISVIPSSNNIGQLRVNTAKSNQEWVIVNAELTNENKRYYYLISKDLDLDNLDCDKFDCDSIIHSHIIGPLDSLLFLRELKQKHINLRFSD